MSSTTLDRPAAPAIRVVAGLLAAAVAATFVNALIALAASAIGPGATPVGLQIVQFGPASVVGVLLGTAGWAVVRRFAARPRAVLRVLVPVVVLLTFGADLFLLSTGAGVVNVVALMLMHVVVASATVLALGRVLPVRG
jgi:hypothetical protein